MATSTQRQKQASDTKRKHPQRKQWDYIATLEESEELEKLKSIRKAIAQSQAELENGKGIPATPEFFTDLKKEARARFSASKQ